MAYSCGQNECTMNEVRNQNDLWFQQDGASPHMPARNWLFASFNGRVRGMHHAWPAKSPDLSCLDFWFWGAAMQEVSKSRPSTINELKLVVNRFAVDLSEDAVIRATQHIRRAQACVHESGAHFEHAL